jgi:hypothetical protein
MISDSRGKAGNHITGHALKAKLLKGGDTMIRSPKYFLLALGGGALALTSVASEADARPARHVYKVCRKSSGTAGLIAGGAGGAAVGSAVIGGGIAGPIVGAVGGAFAGRAIDRSMTAKRRCHYVTRR